MRANWTRVLLLVGVVLTGCQSGLLPIKPKGAAATGLAGVSAEAPSKEGLGARPVVAAKAPAGEKDKEAATPHFEPGDYVEGYRQPKGSLIPPVLPPGKALQTSVKK